MYGPTPPAGVTVTVPLQAASLPEHTVGSTFAYVEVTGALVDSGTVTCIAADLPSESITVKLSVPTGAGIEKI